MVTIYPEIRFCQLIWETIVSDAGNHKEILSNEYFIILFL